MGHGTAFAAGDADPGGVGARKGGNIHGNVRLEIGAGHRVGEAYMQNAAGVAKSNRDGIAHIQVYRRGALITLAREGARTVESADAVGSKHHPARSAGRSGVDV